LPEHHRRTSLTESITSFRNLRAPLLRAALEEVANPNPDPNPNPNPNPERRYRTRVAHSMWLVACWCSRQQLAWR